MYKYRPVNNQHTYYIGYEITASQARDIYARREDRQFADYVGSVVVQRNRFIPVETGREYRTMKQAVIAIMRRRMEGDAQS